MAGLTKSRKATANLPGRPAASRAARNPARGPIAAAKAKAGFLALIDQVSTEVRPVIVTKRGKPLVQIAPLKSVTRKDPFGCMKGSVQTTGDVVGPEPDLWEAMA